MSARFDRHGRARRAVFGVACLGLASTSLLAIAACAASDESEATEPDSSAVVPRPDAGGDAPDDAAADVDGAAPCAPGSLCRAPTPLTTGFVTAIRGRSKGDVWASGTGGLLMRYDGLAWTALESGISDTLASLFLAEDETWGISGTLVLRRRLDRESVRTLRSPSRPLSSITGLPGGGVYVSVIGPHSAPPVPRPGATVDFDTRVLTYPAGPFLPWSDVGQELALRASFLVPGGPLWLVGDRGTVVRYPVELPAAPADAGDGGDAGDARAVLGTGNVIPAPALQDLLAAWGDGEQLWAVGRGGTILHYDGAGWHTPPSGTTATLNAVFGLSPSDVWAAGDDGTALHFDGETWSVVDRGAYRGSLRAIWAAAKDDVWIGGEDGMFHWGVLP